jgi:hypothetical protein
VVIVFIVVILLSSPSVWAFGTNPTLSAGQQYNLQLQATEVSVGGNPYTPPNKDMTVTLGRTNLGNLMMEFEWTHDPGSGVPASNYALILGFDFNNDGQWTDPDYSTNGYWSVYTPDDALGLVALGPNIDICLGRDCNWLNIYIPTGLYVASWGIDPNDIKEPTWVAIGGPPGPQNGPHGSVYNGIKGPGPQYRGSTPTNLNFIEFTPYYTAWSGTSYVMKVGVPLRLFHSMTGFGFFLSQQTAVCVDSECGTPWLTWMWPTPASPLTTDLFTALGEKAPNDPTVGIGARLLGNLDPDAEGPYNYVLADPPGPGEPVPGEPVGGFATAADRIALVAPWIALTSILGAALVLAVVIAKRRKV